LTEVISLVTGPQETADRARESKRRFTQLLPSGQIDTVRLLLNKGARIETKDRTGRNALHCGSWCGHVEIVKLLLGRGALVNSKDQEGRTALIGAAGNGHGHVVQLLLNHGADKKVKGGGGNIEGNSAGKGCEEQV
jgi:ankyrin repeat protein